MAQGHRVIVRTAGECQWLRRVEDNVRGMGLGFAQRKGGLALLGVKDWEVFVRRVAKLGNALHSQKLFTRGVARFNCKCPRHAQWCPGRELRTQRALHRRDGCVHKEGRSRVLLPKQQLHLQVENAVYVLHSR